MPFSELADAAGAMLLLVLCSAPAAAYRLSYVLPYDRFKVAVLDSLERCLQFLDELSYLPDCVVVEEDDLAGGAEAATTAISAVRKRASAAELPIVRVVRNGGLVTARSSNACTSPVGLPMAAAVAAADTLLAPFDAAELDARVTAQVTLRRQHQQRAAAHATLTVLRYILPPPAFADLTHGSPWATRVHGDLSLLTAVLVDPHATAGVAAAAPVVQSPVSLMAALHDAHAAFDGLCAMYGVTKMSTMGHEYVAVGGLDGRPDHLVRLMRVAAGMVAALLGQQQAQIQAGVPPLEVQIGLHAGPCVAGVVGRTRPTYTLLGDVVVIANQLRSTSHPMCVHVSSAVRDQLQPANAGSSSSDGGGGGSEFAFVAATSRTVGGGPSGLGPARTYFAKLGHWRAALSAPGPATAGSAISRGGPVMPNTRQVRRSTHSGRAMMAAAAAGAAAAGAAGGVTGPAAPAAGGGVEEVGTGHPPHHRQPAKAQSASSIETGRRSLLQHQHSIPHPSPYPHHQQYQHQSREVGPTSLNPASAEGARARTTQMADDGAAQPRTVADGAEAAAAGAAATFTSPVSAATLSSGGSGGRDAAPASPSHPSAAAAAAEYGAVAAAIATKNVRGPPRRAPPGRVYSNLSNATSLFAPSTVTSGSVQQQQPYLQAHGSVGPGSSVATQAHSSGSSLHRVDGVQLGNRDGGANAAYGRLGSGGPPPAAAPAPLPQSAAGAAAAGGSSYFLSQQMQQQQQQQGPSAALPTVDEDLGACGPGGVSGSLGGFTAALYNFSNGVLSNGLLSNAQLNSSAVPTGRSTVCTSGGLPAEYPHVLRSGTAGMAPAAPMATVNVAAAAAQSTPAKGGRALVLQRTGSAALQPGSSGEDSLALRRVSGIGAEHNPYMVYTNISDLAGGGSGAGRGSGPGVAGAAAAAAGGGGTGAVTSSALGDTSGTPSEPTQQGITHSELMYLLTTSSVVLPTGGGGGGGAILVVGGGKDSMMSTLDDIVRSGGGLKVPSGACEIAAEAASPEEARPGAARAGAAVGADTAPPRELGGPGHEDVGGGEEVAAAVPADSGNGSGGRVSVDQSSGLCRSVSLSARGYLAALARAESGRLAQGAPRPSGGSITSSGGRVGDTNPSGFTVSTPAVLSVAPPLTAAEAAFVASFGSSAGSASPAPKVPPSAPRELSRSGGGTGSGSAASAVAAAASPSQSAAETASCLAAAAAAATSSNGALQLLPSHSSQRGLLLLESSKAASSVDGATLSSNAFTTTPTSNINNSISSNNNNNSMALVGPSELAMLLQVAQRSVGGGGNSGSSISFPHLQELVSATLRDAGAGRAPGSSVSASSIIIQNGHVQVLNASNENAAASSSQDCSDNDMPAPSSRIYGSAGSGTATATLTAGQIRRRSIDVQRALATAAAVGAAASHAVAAAGNTASAGSLGSGSGSAAAAGAQEIQRLCRTFQQLYNHQYQLQQQAQSQTQIRQLRPLVSQQQQQHMADTLAPQATDLRPWVLAELSLTGSDNSLIPSNVTEGRALRPLSETALTSAAVASMLLSGVSGTGSDTAVAGLEAGGARTTDGGGGGNDSGGGVGRPRALQMVPGAGLAVHRSRPAAGYPGWPSALSTVPDLPTPPSSSCLSYSRDNSRNPLPSQQLPSNHTLLTATNTGALSALLLQQHCSLPQAAAAAAAAVLALASNSSSSAGGGCSGSALMGHSHLAAYDSYHHYAQAPSERRHAASPLSRGEVASVTSPPLVLLGTGTGTVGTGPASLTESTAEGVTRVHEHYTGGLEISPAVVAVATVADAMVGAVVPATRGEGCVTAAAVVGSGATHGSAGPSTQPRASVGTSGTSGARRHDGGGGGGGAAPGSHAVPAALLSSLGGEAAWTAADAAILRTENSSIAVGTSSVLLSTQQSMGGHGAAGGGAGGSDSHAAAGGGERPGSSGVWSGSATGGSGGVERSAVKRHDSLGVGGFGSQSDRRSAASMAVAFFRKRSRRQRSGQSGSPGLLVSGEVAGGRLEGCAGGGGGGSGGGAPVHMGSSGLSTGTTLQDDPRGHSIGQSGGLSSAAGTSAGGGGGGALLSGMLRTLSFGKLQKPRGSSKSLKP